MPVIQADDRARPVPLGQHHDRCVRHADLLVSIAGNDFTGATKPLLVESRQGPGSAGQLAEHGQLVVHPVSGGDELVQLRYHIR